MKTQEPVDEQMFPPEPAQPKNRSCLATIGAILVVVLVVGGSALLFAQLSQHHKSQSQSALSSGKWVQVLNGYIFTSLEATASTPSTLYACAIRSQTGTAKSNQSAPGNAASFTVLRSTDFGVHWQDVGTKVSLGDSCELAINPSNSDDLFALGISSADQVSSVLKHSIDGGQTWISIQSTIKLPNSSAAPAWNLQQLNFVGTTLFGVQWLPQSANPVIGQGGPLPKAYTRLSRLISSVDGGHIWTVLDQQFSASRQGVSDYAVDPLHTNTIYDLVSVPWLPIQPSGAEPNDIIPPLGNNGELYKTTDNGATWHLLLKDLPFGTQIHLAQHNPQVLYIGGARHALPYVAKAPGADYPNAIAPGSFHLQVSSDGGATWREVPNVAQASFIQSWLADPNGQVFSYSGSTSAGANGQSTAVASTAVAAPPHIVPPSTPQTVSPANAGVLSVAYRPASTAPPSGPASSFGSIQGYEPSSNAWHEVTKSPTYGTLLTVTPDQANSDVLWFMGSNNGQSVLYRYVV